MLKRQRVLLLMLDKAGGAASRMQVTKWAFLLRHESDSRGGRTFYRFVPYRYGPFSFCLYQEANALRRCGYLEEIDRKNWRVLQAGVQASAALDASIKDDVSRIVSRYPRHRLSGLVDHVYEQYEWFTLLSKSGARVELPVVPPAIYTAGYEGHLIDGFLNALLHNGIRRLVDVRNNPVSRRYGYHKSTLDRLCRHVNIKYYHYPNLGIASQQRQEINTADDYNALFEQYESSVLNSQADEIQELAELMGESPSVLVCAETDPRFCHRSRLAKRLAELGRLPVRHLGLLE